MDGITDKICSKWMEGKGPEAEIVISSRIRLARNIENYPFPYLSSDSQAEEVLDMVWKVLQKGSDKMSLIKISELEPLEREVLVEKHLISPLLVKESRNSAVVIGEDESISIMINEEDHLRIQCLFPGLQLDKAWEAANGWDDLLEKQIKYAFHEELGYLTACPTNVGTGMRASVMVHLPGLVITKQINRILAAISQVGLAVRGFYGEGTEIVGNIVQISNQITLGQSEGEILQNLYGVTCQIIEQEKRARQILLNEGRDQLADRAGRAYGILANSRLIKSEEAMRLLSDFRLGNDLRLVDKLLSLDIMNELLVFTGPAVLQKLAGKKLPPQERDLIRARVLREKLAQK